MPSKETPLKAISVREKTSSRFAQRPQSHFPPNSSLRVDIKSKGEDMSELTKVEITIVDGEWQWMGLLSKKSLKLLTQIADTMSDSDTTTK